MELASDDACGRPLAARERASVAGRTLRPALRRSLSALTGGRRRAQEALRGLSQHGDGSVWVCECVRASMRARPRRCRGAPLGAGPRRPTRGASHRLGAEVLAEGLAGLAQRRDPLELVGFGEEDAVDDLGEALQGRDRGEVGLGAGG